MSTMIFLGVDWFPGGDAYLLVISNVVPKIWARTNSAILGRGEGERSCRRGDETEKGENQRIGSSGQ